MPWILGAGWEINKSGKVLSSWGSQSIVGHQLSRKSPNRCVAIPGDAAKHAMYMRQCGRIMQGTNSVGGGGLGADN